jgi:hypothetical protein
VRQSEAGSRHVVLSAGVADAAIRLLSVAGASTPLRQGFCWMTSSDDGGDRLRPDIWADVCAECLGVRLATATPTGAVFPVGGIVNATTSTGESPVHSWTSDGGAQTS